MNKARLFATLKNKQVRCLACQRYCQINEGQTGFCQTRLNEEGNLYSLTHGLISGIQVDPIEKKPLYHFYPGTDCLSFGSYGCNYRCRQCLNYHCSWGEPAKTLLEKIKNKKVKFKDKRSRLLRQPADSGGQAKFKLRASNFELQTTKTVSPEEIVSLALQKNCPGIAFTYNEPSIWPEYVYDCARLAKEKGLYTVYVTNGSWTKESLDYLAGVIDACNIDIKGFYPQTYAKMGAFFGGVLKITALVVKKYKIFTELTTLVIPAINDSTKELQAIAGWIVKNLGPEVPWHLSRFDPSLSPDSEFRKLPETPVKTLKKAYQIGKKAGLEHIYVWAPPKKRGEELFSIGNTACPKCGRLVVKRNGWQPDLAGVSNGKCKFCGAKLNFCFGEGR